MYILHAVLYTFLMVSNKENLFSNQVLLYFVIISFIVMTLMYDSEMMLLGEIRC